MDNAKRLCNKYIQAYLFDESDVLLVALQFYRERDKLSDIQKSELDFYFSQQCNNYREKYKDAAFEEVTIGNIESYPIK